ncbi:MAG: DUF1571 domain-containing protein [Thermoguttaceae bacterium]|nr:DUF1571 domain-containing protein [Thermoguttaceae bacterium]
MSRFTRICIITGGMILLLTVIVVGGAIWLGVGAFGVSPMQSEDHAGTPTSVGSTNTNVPTTSPTQPDTVGRVDVELDTPEDGSLPDLTPREGEHPLARTLAWAKRELPRVKQIPGYSAMFTKRETIHGELGETTQMFLKIRHQPLSIYLRYEVPQKNKGVEAIYLETPDTPSGKGKMWGHGVGLERIIGTLELDPYGKIAMLGQKYPITTIGILKMLNLLIEVGSKDTAYGECEVAFAPDMVWNGRHCAEVVVTHPVKRDYFVFYRAIIRVDLETHLPVFYQAYNWPEAEGGAPPLIEEFYYEDVQLLDQLTDEDFDTKNPGYHFP